MIAVDTNILVHAARTEMPLHQPALAKLYELAEGPRAWGLPVFCVVEFIRVVSHPRLFSPPTPAPEASEMMGALLESPSSRLLQPSDQFLFVLDELLRESGASGNLVFDAQIVALCLEHGATTLLTEDRDFDRFAGLQTLRLN